MMNDTNQPYIIIDKVKYPTRFAEIPINELKYYPENPRIYNIVWEEGKEPDQNYIQSVLQAKEHVKKLAKQIEENGGLKVSVFVRDGDNVVLEGNSRLAAFRMLAESDPFKFSKIPARILPNDMPQSAIMSLLAELHIKKKTDWAPFEQAGYIYRAHTEQNMELKEIVKTSGMNASVVNQYFTAYELMVKFSAPSNKWSFYLEYAKTPGIQAYRKEYENKLDVAFNRAVENGEFPIAEDVRQFKNIVKAQGVIRHEFAEGGIPYHKALERALNSGSGDRSYQKIVEFKKLVSSKNFAKNKTKDLNSTEIKNWLYEIDLIETAIKTLTRFLKSRRDEL